MSLIYLDIIQNIGGALVAGSLIGLERTFHGRPAGFRTHALVCLASAILMLVTTHQWGWLAGVPLETIRTDPTRMAQGIMTGIGFLGAGVIFNEGVTVRGLTTAASIWVTAAVGILFGVGFYFPAILSTVIVLGVLALFRHLEDLIPSQLYVHNVLRFAREKTLEEAELRRMFQEHDFSVMEISYALINGGAEFEYRTVIMTRHSTNVKQLVARLRGMDDLLEFRVSPTSD
ncbi:MAG: MgtC/SapB family protein [Rhodospirillales bacterium]|nr:MgtC/SapB family protein [Rhodospirillales bacterium]